MKKILPIIIVFFFSNPVFAWTEGDIDMMWMHCFAYEEKLSLAQKYEFCGCLPEQYLINFDSKNEVTKLADKGEGIFNNDPRVLRIYKTCDKRLSRKKSLPGYTLENIDHFWEFCIAGGYAKKLSTHKNLAYCGCLTGELIKKIDYNKYTSIKESLLYDKNPSNDILYLRKNLDRTCSDKVF